MTLAIISTSDAKITACWPEGWGQVFSWGEVIESSGQITNLVEGLLGQVAEETVSIWGLLGPMGGDIFSILGFWSNG